MTREAKAGSEVELVIQVAIGHTRALPMRVLSVLPLTPAEEQVGSPCRVNLSDDAGKLMHDVPHQTYANASPEAGEMMCWRWPRQPPSSDAYEVTIRPQSIRARDHLVFHSRPPGEPRRELWRITVNGTVYWFVETTGEYDGWSRSTV